MKLKYTDSYKASEQTFEQFKKGHKSSELDNYQLARYKQRRVVKMPRKYGIVDLISYALTIADEVNGEEPMSYKETMSSDDKSKWVVQCRMK